MRIDTSTSLSPVNNITIYPQNPDRRSPVTEIPESPMAGQHHLWESVPQDILAGRLAQETVEELINNTLESVKKTVGTDLKNRNTEEREKTLDIIYQRGFKVMDKEKQGLRRYNGRTFSEAVVDQLKQRSEQRVAKTVAPLRELIELQLGNRMTFDRKVIEKLEGNSNGRLRAKAIARHIEETRQATARKYTEVRDEKLKLREEKKAKKIKEEKDNLLNSKGQNDPTLSYQENNWFDKNKLPGLRECLKKTAQSIALLRNHPRLESRDVQYYLKKELEVYQLCQKSIKKEEKRIAYKKQQETKDLELICNHLGVKI